MQSARRAACGCAEAMSRLHQDVVARIGGFCTPEDRRTCSTAHRSASIPKKGTIDDTRVL